MDKTLEDLQAEAKMIFEAWMKVDKNTHSNIVTCLNEQLENKMYAVDSKLKGEQKHFDRPIGR